jgi:hypothetical protein
MAGLADRPRYGRPLAGGRQLTSRIAALLDRPGPWTLPRIWRYLGQLQASLRTLYRAGGAGGDLVAAQADRPRRPRP